MSETEFEALKAMLALVNEEMEAIRKLNEQTLAEIKEINAVNALRDSVEWGTAGKQGVKKAYIDASRPRDAIKRLDNMIYLGIYAQVMSTEMWAESEGGTVLPREPMSMRDE